MQQTRLNTLVNSSLLRLEYFFSNPWRRIALNLLAFLLGVFMALSISSTAGQAAKLDISVGILLVLFTEFVNRLAYNRKTKRLFWINLLNIVKIGLVYGLFLQALILGS